jgi:hypothetical protein
MTSVCKTVGIVYFSSPICASLQVYNNARPTKPTAPMTHDAAFACDAPAGFAVVEAAAPLPDALGLLPLVDVPLGLPEMFC